jgi:hypothetical protein
MFLASRQQTSPFEFADTYPDGANIEHNGAAALAAGQRPTAVTHYPLYGRLSS